MRQIGNPGDATRLFNGGTALLGYADATILTPLWANTVQQELMGILAAAGVAPDETGADMVQVLASLQRLFGPGRIEGIPQVFVAGGSYLLPPGTEVVRVRMGGGGGGGGGTEACGAGVAAVGASGGSGAVIEAWLLTAQMLAPYPSGAIPIVIGAGGAGGARGDNAGGNGGTTTFGGALLSAPGGGGGQFGAGVGHAFMVPGGPAGGSPTGTGIVLGCNGRGGSVGLVFDPGGSFYAVGGAGGSSPLGFAGGEPTGGNTMGNPGQYCAGASGSICAPGGPGYAGGNGGGGWCEVTAYTGAG